MQKVFELVVRLAKQAARQRKRGGGSRNARAPPQPAACIATKAILSSAKRKMANRGKLESLKPLLQANLRNDEEGPSLGGQVRVEHKTLCEVAESAGT